MIALEKDVDVSGELPIVYMLSERVVCEDNLVERDIAVYPLR